MTWKLNTKCATQLNGKCFPARIVFLLAFVLCFAVTVVISFFHASPKKKAQLFPCVQTGISVKRSNISSVWNKLCKVEWNNVYLTGEVNNLY